ncbi:tRNA pseudouridine synthase-like 1 [Haliotis rufescens]|uniref:tRNA pseudouridine synthase-like 1 n=1 Tax=Haliotis rufescens TaxID=6454 RepID=UPI00201F2526|nr:tRNA pseudouridine synthase-like 1 [Haliotis rufescens]
MGRYLMFIQYLGTQYSGIQVQRVSRVVKQDVKTIQGTIERHLKKLLPTWESNLCLSSRTDKKVHAFCNAVHFDFNHESRLKEQSDLDRLKFILNVQFHKAKEDIKILRIQQVNDNFVSRYAAGRNYLYRLAVIPEDCGFQQALSVVERNRISVVRSPFDVGLFLKSAELLAGTHNFSAFTTLKGTQFKNPVKNVVIGVRGGQADRGVCQHLGGEKCHFWDVHVQAKSFLYHQVRHMVSSMVAVARGKLHLDDLRHVLEYPLDRDHMSYSAMPRISPNGLYLDRVKYKPADLEYAPNEDDKTVEGMSDANRSPMSASERVQETIPTDGDEDSVTAASGHHDGADNQHQSHPTRGNNSRDHSNVDILEKSVGKVT